jgi:CRISPR-associated endonuclease/helicase Cas3
MWPAGVMPAWGKLERDLAGRVTASHALADHMLDVAACFLALAACRNVRRALTCAAGRELLPLDLQRLAVLVFLHDLGKANAGFQAKRWKLAQEVPRGWPTHRGHVSEALFLFEEGSDPDLLNQLPIAAISAWGPAVCDLLLASISHHGQPAKVAPNGDGQHLWQPVQVAGQTVYSPQATLQQLGRRVQQLFPEAVTPGGADLPGTPAFVHLFAGLVQLADWLGSDTRFFPYTAPRENRASTAFDGARNAVRSIGLDTHALHDALQGAMPDFCAAFGVPQPRPIQQALGAPDLGPLLILEAETGSGKTEAALWRFAQLFKAGQVDGLYFALPTRVAASQLYERLRHFVQRMWPADGGVAAPVVVRALPGYASADGSEPQQLPGFQVLWPDQPAEQQAHRRWAAESSKRFLAATIAVGTIDQALLAALQVRHAHLRHALLTRSLLVVDEVHASDAYMAALLEHLLQAHRRAGGQALLLSATLGASARARLQVLAQADRPNPPLPHLPSLETACTMPYPALSDGTRMHLLQPSAAQKTMHWQTLDAINDPARMARLATEAAAAGARVLVIRNTVPAAIATLQAVEAIAATQGAADWLFTLTPPDGGAPVSTLHHSRYSRQDRPLLDRAVEAQIGKQRQQPGGRIVIGTQTLEQSLDLDADLLITDLCPMDVLLQRIGRLHRHSRPEHERPDGYRHAQAWVLTPAGGDLTPHLKQPRHGLGRFHQGGGVYPDLRILEATRRLIDAAPTRQIPRDNRELVERATHPQARQQIEQALGAAWVKHGQDIDGETGAGKTIAHLQALPYDKPFEGLTFPDAEQKVATRLGAADRLVEFDPPLRGPFGLDVRQLAIRHHLLPPELPFDVTPEHIQPISGGFEFSLGARRYRYSRVGLECLPD